MTQRSLATTLALACSLLVATGCGDDDQDAAAPAASATALPAASAPAKPGSAVVPTVVDEANAPWTCAAFCLGSFTCSITGPSKWDQNFHTAGGRTAAEAFDNLHKKCVTDGALIDIVKGFHCIDYKPVFEWASLSDACARTN